ncbi:hypothetical protein ACFYKT_07570 [Cytobacillus sp. FJAT-53684]|uniref:Uncharacterized protein n=1 Tax=Cytobacillus mangrovibacter TaxID=3299024 RepID=A0ABW6JZQ1_9BACI
MACIRVKAIASDCNRYLYRRPMPELLMIFYPLQNCPKQKKPVEMYAECDPHRESTFLHTSPTGMFI